MRLAIPLLLVGCGPGLFQNSAPKLKEINGVEVGNLTGIPSGDPRLQFTPGEVFTVELDISDQEGHDVSVWWPDSPRGWRFPSDGTTGEWDVPPADELLDPRFLIVLEDNHPKRPMTASWRVPLWSEGMGTEEDSGL